MKPYYLSLRDEWLYIGPAPIIGADKVVEVGAGFVRKHLHRLPTCQVRFTPSDISWKALESAINRNHKSE